MRVATLRGYNPRQRHVVMDAKPTKFSRKRRAPVDEISGKNELGRERSNEMELGADNTNDAALEEPCKRVPAHSGAHLIHGATIATTAKVKKSTRKKFWYYQPIADDEPKPVDMMQQDEQLGMSCLELTRICC